MRLQNLDLNLLFALQAVLDERHVTRAGQRLGLSQPAMSDALRRLRRHFDDELIVREGNRYELTPFGLVLRSRVADAVSAVENAFAARWTSETPRAYTLLSTGNGVLNVVRPLMDDLREQSVDLQLRMVDLPGLAARPDWLAAADGVLAAKEFGDSFPSIDLYTDQWVVISAVGHDTAITMEDLATRPLAVMGDSQGGHSPALNRLHRLGVDPRIEIIGEDFLTLPHLVTDSDRIALMPRRLAAKYAFLVDLHACPFDAPELVETFWWHPSRTADPGHLWLRDQITATARRLAQEQFDLESPKGPAA
ncbi:LysR family transcriptional regulator [Streptomyces mangrovisoli]|uniref:HTH lysR-type domain-containing protein n=1 Tax=Streptomyces mangrovisoli TaxID=1428628 RepID=A0A1J4NT59_9ACTN|nr:LysR family transcriptional regulator [Streptomyces mangrovisoli]OIJ65488.1 hypothetical protein WN71_023365 [Streptomyces mangrovisoli]